MQRHVQLAALFGLVVGVGCGGSDSPSGPIKVGLLAPKTGTLASIGQSWERVGKVAIDYINAKGGANGRPLELLVDDTETNKDLAAAKFQGLVDMGAVAIVGPATSGEVSNAWPVAKMTKVPLMSPSSTDPALSRPAPVGPDDGGYMFRNVPDDEIQGIAMAYYIYMLRSPVVTNLAVVYENTGYGKGLKDAFKTSFTNLGGTISQEITFEQHLANVAAAAPTIDQLVNATTQPTFVVMIALEGDAINLSLSWDNNGSPKIPGLQFFFVDGARTAGFLHGDATLTPPEAPAPASVRGMCGTAPTFPISGLAYKELQTAYEAVNTDKLGDLVYAPNVWDGFFLFTAAMMQQMHAHPGEDVGGDHLRDAITQVSRDGQTFHAGQWRDLVSAIRAGNDVDYDGASGPQDLDVVGQAVGPYEVWCISADGSTFEQKLFLDAKDIQALKP